MSDLSRRAAIVSAFSLAITFGAVMSSYAAEPVQTSTTGVTLADCFAKAKAVSESIGISAENTRLLESQYHEKFGDILPHIDWIKTQFYQQHIPSNSNGATGSSLLSTQPQSYFQLVQPLFSGFRDWKALDIARSLQQQSRFEEEQAQQQLLSDVASAFYSALTAQEQLVTLNQTKTVTQDRVKELKRWVNIGRSLSSDLLSAQTQLATLDAQIADAERTQNDAREALHFLTELPSDVVLVDDRPDPQVPPLQEALTRSGRRPDLMSQEEALRQAQLNVSYMKGTYWPTLGFLGRYFTERVGFLSDVRWDATFTLDVPLLEGGSNHYQIQEARSQQLVAELTLHRLQRSIEQQVRSTQQDLAILAREAAAYQIAADMGQKNYEAQTREYRQGRTTNIEVLQVLTNLQNVKSQAVLSKYSAKLEDVLLRVAMGEGL
jgi:outer membrane protein